jgi:hypothetical protein
MKERVADEKIAAKSNSSASAAGPVSGGKDIEATTVASVAAATTQVSKEVTRAVSNNDDAVAIIRSKPAEVKLGGLKSLKGALDKALKLSVEDSTSKLNATKSVRIGSATTVDATNEAKGTAVVYRVNKDASVVAAPKAPAKALVPSVVLRRNKPLGAVTAASVTLSTDEVAAAVSPSTSAVTVEEKSSMLHKGNDAAN